MKVIISMKINRKSLKEMVKEVVLEMKLSESDIIAKEKSEWKDMKKEFRDTVSELLNNIEDDNYSDANGDIEKVVKTLKAWKRRITKNISDSTGA
jgi:Txe/YoeB family toxin of Txe-Axe toxin-antitoxin module